MNVVLLTLDTTRADHLATYGYFRQTTPRIEAFAQGGLTFDQFLVPMATTLPTHTTMLTGIEPSEHGVLANLKHGGQQFRTSEQLHTLAQAFQAAGYRTGAFVSASPLKPGSGIEAGFDVYDAPAGPFRPAPRTLERAAAWTARRPKQPFFLWVHLYDPHSPLEPPPPFDVLFQDDPSLRTWLDDRGFQSTFRPSGTEVEPISANNLYDGELAAMDQAVGRLLDLSYARGWGGRTLWMIAGDHGEGLGQHGEPGHGQVWYEQIHAPLFLRGPGVPAGRHPGVVTASDLLPTLLGLLDLPGSDRLLAQASGRDVLDPSAPRRPVVHLTSDRQVGLGATGQTALSVGPWRYVRRADGRELLFDRRQDPHELSDVARYWPEIVDRMRVWLAEEEARHAVKAQRLGATTGAALSEADLEALRSLGYLDEPQEEAAP